MKKKSKLLLVSVILSLVWMILCSSILGTGVEAGMSAGDAEAVGATIGAMLLLPYMVVAWIGTLLNCLGWLMNIRGLALAAAILFCVSLILGITYGFGLIPSIILSFAAFATMKNKPNT